MHCKPRGISPALGSDRSGRRRPGSRIGRYVIREHLGSGGMADIYLAQPGAGGEAVALKCLLACNLGDPEYRKMLVDEATLMSRLQHPNLVRALDISRVDKGYFTMEYVRGAPLSGLFRVALARGREVPIDVAVSIMQRVATALHHAHELRDDAGNLRNVVHRDVTMANILIRMDGVVKLTDFGVAKATGRATETRAGYLKGKTGHMSPEQVLGREIDRRSDVFSMGIVLWELLAGAKLFHGKTDYERMQNIACAVVPPLSTVRNGVPRHLEMVIRRALRRNPAARYRSALHFAAALATASGDDVETSTVSVAAWVRSFLRSTAPGDAACESEDAVDVDLDDDDEPSIIIEFATEDGSDAARHPRRRASTRAHTLDATPRARSEPRRGPASYLGYPNSADIAAFFEAARSR